MQNAIEYSYIELHFANMKLMKGIFPQLNAFLTADELSTHPEVYFSVLVDIALTNDVIHYG